MRATLSLCSALFLVACPGEAFLADKDQGADPTADDTDVGLPLVDTEVPEETDVPADSDPPVFEDPPQAAEEPIYAHTETSLYTVDPVTGDSTSIGRTQDEDGDAVALVDIAIDRDGRLFGGSQKKKLYRIDPNSAVMLEVCDLDSVPFAMAFTSDGLLVIGDTSGLSTLDVDDDCSSTTLIEDKDLVTSGDVVGLPDGQLYWTVRGNKEDRLVVVDPEDPSNPDDRGGLGYERLFGVGYDQTEEALYGFSADGDIVSIDPVTADTRLLDRSTSRKWWGATTNPVLWK